ncbi:hypothetical protein [Moorena sp. SIO4A5]|uniref:hypothetical protein n=1 Tax=Moorena sp. SIO4A5 TaxID=2607838 RepID=UPI0013C68C58|nr:hypothetical protein [Moorena sp. SIO4A5]NEO23729.1 hypothetical protein [Moorena sp. SIO4A5]
MILRVGARLLGREQSLAPLGRTCRMGILPWNGHLAWNWHLASFNIFSSGQDAHSTPIHYLTDATPPLFTCSLFPVPCSLFPVPCSLQF